MWKLIVFWTAMLGCIACKDFIQSGPSEGYLEKNNLDHSKNSGHFVMKDQGYIDKDEIEPNHGEDHDTSNTGSGPQLLKDDSYFPYQLSSDLGSNKRADTGSPSKDDLRHSKMKNADQSSKADQEGETEETERQKTRKPRYPPDCRGISSMEDSFWTFKDLRKKLGFIDKTKFILDFHYELGEATCILRPKRSGKTLAIKMLKEFY
jgi:hypothetical protein